MIKYNFSKKYFNVLNRLLFDYFQNYFLSDQVFDKNIKASENE